MPAYKTETSFTNNEQSNYSIVMEYLLESIYLFYSLFVS